MTRSPEEDRWEVVARIVEVRSAWLALIGERLRDRTGREREYWRVEKPDSMIVVTVHHGRLILPSRAYRPGVGRPTLDFAGGRLEASATPSDAAAAIVRREFNLSAPDLFESHEQLNDTGWDVDSSSSSQRVYGMAVELNRAVALPEAAIGASYPATAGGGRELLRDLVCVQCRAVLGAWLDRQS